MQRFFLATIALWTLAIVPNSVRAQDMNHDHDHDHQAARVYYDRVHKDKHEWNDHEAAAWNGYRDEHHVKQTDFARANRRQQQNYWNWRHEHPDNH